MINRHLQTLFCDDIRHEVGGKLSFIGVYSGRLQVKAFPATLARLCLVVNVVTPVSQPLQSLTLRVFRDDEVMQEIKVEEDDLVQALESLEKLPGEQAGEAIQTANFLLNFSPIRFHSPCKLRVIAATESEELVEAGLLVRQRPR